MRVGGGGAHNRFSGNLREQVDHRISTYGKIEPFSQRAINRFQLVAGAVEETLPDLSFGPIRFKIVEVDLNLRQGTKVALDKFWPLLVPGGLLVFGGYSTRPWTGETEEVHRFLQEKGLVPSVIQGVNYPSCYVVKR